MRRAAGVSGTTVTPDELEAMRRLVREAMEAGALGLSTGHASSSNVTVPARGVSLLDIDAGAASVNIRVPEATAARIRVEEGVNSVNVDTNRFPRLDSGFYQSTGYDTASDRADINIEAGLGSVTVM